MDQYCSNRKVSILLLVKKNFLHFKSAIRYIKMRTIVWKGIFQSHLIPLSPIPSLSSSVAIQWSFLPVGEEQWGKTSDQGMRGGKGRIIVVSGDAQKAVVLFYEGWGGNKFHPSCPIPALLFCAVLNNHHWPVKC